MITKDTIAKILDTARIEEVVTDFVSLKKRGANWLGLCPFHNEKTPSFNVSPSRGIYKCFGCGKAGNAVNFIMEHEHYSYPEALRLLANKYNVEVEEEYSQEDDAALRDEKESLFIVTEFAGKFYQDYLFDSDEGKSTGLTYFEERGFDEKTIRKFQLGLAPRQQDALLNATTKKGYRTEILEKAGLILKKENSGEHYDRFRARAVFPIHNITGKIIAFGARILQKDPKAPKYINSPETEIYHKSKILYGIYFAKKSIVEKDECYLTEGYTDVISLHREGIENVVASSGTSLTVEQIKLIGRYTKNITVLYDGDAAGIKASLRGIELILEEGLNVKVVLFPDGEDPDSFARSHSHSEMLNFLKENKQDFIRFKTSLLLHEVVSDPIGKAELIRDIVETISKIPDGIKREMYVKQCSVLMDVSEPTLMMELNKIRRKNFTRQIERDFRTETEDFLPEIIKPEQALMDEMSAENQEAEIIRILLNYGDRDVEFKSEDEKGHPVIQKIKAKDVLLNELLMDGIGFDDELLAGIFSYFSNAEIKEFSHILEELKNHNEEKIRMRAIDFLTTRHELSDWASVGIYVKTEEFNFTQAVLSPVYHLKLKRVIRLKKENQQKLKETRDVLGEWDDFLNRQKEYDRIISDISKFLGVVVVK